MIPCGCQLCQERQESKEFTILFQYGPFLIYSDFDLEMLMLLAFHKVYASVFRVLNNFVALISNALRSKPLPEILIYTYSLVFIFRLAVYLGRATHCRRTMYTLQYTMYMYVHNIGVRSIEVTVGIFFN
jgi:hypothetical protein